MAILNDLLQAYDNLKLRADLFPGSRRAQERIHQIEDRLRYVLISEYATPEKYQPDQAETDYLKNHPDRRNSEREGGPMDGRRAQDRWEKAQTQEISDQMATLSGFTKLTKEGEKLLAAIHDFIGD